MLMYSTGKSPGFTLRNDGGDVISTGSSFCAVASAVCTSSEAPSMLRPRSNWIVICETPSADDEFIAVMPAIVESWRSIGEATDAAMVSGLAPGSDAVIWMVGKSTAGRAATASSRYAKAPKTISDAVINVVITGRRMQASDICMDQAPLFGSLLLSCVVTGDPLIRRSWPSVTTVSPPCNPSLITV